MNLIAFSGPRNCVNTQYAALSGAMITQLLDSKGQYLFFSDNPNTHFVTFHSPPKNVHVHKQKMSIGIIPD